jgi:RpiB/LacA/LacB family sugar-phosphate isomerase
MKLILGSDHAGFLLKKDLKKTLLSGGYSVIDVGTKSERPVDYPEYALKLALRVLAENGKSGEEVRGILICGSGVGASVAANKVRGIRAGLCHDCYSAHQGVEHDNMNVIVFGSRVISSKLAEDLVKVFIEAKFSGEKRHVRRLGEVQALDDSCLPYGRAA